MLGSARLSSPGRPCLSPLEIPKYMQSSPLSAALLPRQAEIPEQISETVPNLLTEADVARRFRCSEFTVRRLRRNGALCFVRVSGSRLIRFREVDIAAYLARSVQPVRFPEPGPMPERLAAGLRQPAPIPESLAAGLSAKPVVSELG